MLIPTVDLLSLLIEGSVVAGELGYEYYKNKKDIDEALEHAKNSKRRREEQDKSVMSIMNNSMLSL